MSQANEEEEEENSDADLEESSGVDTIPSQAAVQEAAEQPIFAGKSSVGDSAAAVDKLGFDIYVNAIADFLVAPNTHAPLTCSIEGSWGSGKSSFMLQLKNRLTAVASDCRTIEFNAWKYDKQEELWAAFALKVTHSLRGRMKWWWRLSGDFSLYRARIKGWGERLSLIALLLAWLLLLASCMGVLVWTARTSHVARVNFIKVLIAAKERPTQSGVPSNAFAQSVAPFEPWYEWLSWSPLATAAILMVLLIGKIPANFRKRLFEARLETYIDRPDYKGKAAFVDAFSEDFSRMIEAYTPPKGAKIFVFIDDLDRCEAPKAADLMQAINLMIGDGNPLIFILGIDRSRVASAIAFKFREIIPYLESSLGPVVPPAEMRGFGDAFLEKFIQLSFRLPRSSNEQQALKFIDSLIRDAAGSEPSNGPKPSQADSKVASEAAVESSRRALRIESGEESQRIRDVVLMVREVVDYSPRRIKTFLNTFRLALYLASSQGLLDVDSKTGEAEVTPEQLGKFIVLNGRYPELRMILERDPVFLCGLERLALNLALPTNDPAFASWLNRPGVLKLMRFGLKEGTLPRDAVTVNPKRYSMENFQVQKFETILPGAPPPSRSAQDLLRTDREGEAETLAEEGRQTTTTVVADS